MDHRDAMQQLEAIHRQMARAEQFRGYRAETVIGSGVLALIGGGLQPVLIPSPADHPGSWLLLWMGIAAATLAAVGWEMLARCRSSQSRLSARLTWQVVELLSPVLFVGASLAIVFYFTAPGILWILPGVWSLLVGLGLFSLSRVLPRSVLLPALFYLIAGLVCLIEFRGDGALAPLAMAVPFGTGQVLLGAVLLFSQERRHVRN